MAKETKVVDAKVLDDAIEVVVTTESFGGRLRRFRKARKYSQKALAERVGISPTTLISYERMENAPPKRKTCEALAEALGITYDELVTGKKNDSDMEAMLLGRFMKTIMFSGGNVSKNDQANLSSILFSELKACMKDNKEELKNFLGELLSEEN